MKIINKLFAILILHVIFLACNKTEQPRRIQPGENLPTFSVKMNDGTIVDNNSFDTGKGLIVFFHTKCPDCVKELEILQPFYDQYKTTIKIVLISRAEMANEIEQFWDEKGYTLPYSAQNNRKVYELFSNTGIPFMVFTENGIVKYTWEQLPTEKSLLTDQK